MKRIIALILVLVLCCGVFSACGETKKTETKQEETIVEDDGVLKILMIGHSLGNDSTYLLPEVFKNENAGPLVMGVIYHSGCRLGQHLEYSSQNAAQYAYYEYDTQVDNQWRRADCNGGYAPFIAGTGTDQFIEDGSIAQTMEFGITRHDWDIIVTQAGVFEAAATKDSAYNVNIAEDLNALLEYVLSKDIEPASKPKIGWNITWTCPSDEMMNDTYKNHLYNNFANADEMYEAIVKTAKDVVAPAYDFEYIFPSGTALQNARSSALEPKDLYRDTIHANDYGRLIVAYTWYCTLTGKDINSCQFGAINSISLVNNLMVSMGQNFEMTEQQKTILIESVTNALASPFAMTQSVN